MISSFASRAICATVVAAGFLTGCIDDLKYQKGDPANGSIGFRAKVSSGWVSTRAEQCDRPYVSDVTGGEGIADSLFLNMTTTQGVMTGTYDLHHAEGLEYDTDRKGEGIVTRATPITPDNGEMYTEFGVSAYSYKGEWDEATAKPNYFYNLKASKSGDGKYTLPDAYFWPGPDYKMRFFAVAPMNNPYYVVSGEEVAGSPKITVDVPGNVGYQKDLLVATSGELDGNARQDVDLQFMHPLTAVRFVVGDDMTSGTINKINIHNVYCQGDLNLDNKQWTLGTQKRTFYQSLGKVVADQGDGNAAPDTEITSPLQTFMMMPQTLPDDAMISMEIKVGTKIYTVSAPIAGQTWLPGTTVTYQLSTTSINWTYTFTASVTKAPSTLENGTISVTSYRTHLTGIKTAVPYNATYAKNGEGNYSTDVPEFLTIDPFVSSISAQTYNVGLLDAEIKRIRMNEPVGQDIPYNLSNSIGASEIENTANCYIIKAAGRYKIPLVYGNAIKNGEPNQIAYKPTETGANMAGQFWDGFGAIQTPYIYNQHNFSNFKVDCKLEYQTMKGAISNLRLDEDKKFIEFEVSREYIKPGNAVISLLRNGVSMWSWHLWFTPMDTNATIPIDDLSGNPKQLMCLYLGQTGYNGNDKLEKDIVSYEIKLSNNNTEKIINIKYDNPPTGPLYMWGRKDPLGIVARNNRDYTTNLVKAYDITGNEISTCEKREMGTELRFRMECVQFPKAIPNNLYATSSINYKTYSWTNLWNSNNSLFAGNNDTSNPIKTVFDPSPPGFCIMSESVGKYLITQTKKSLDNYGYYLGNAWIISLGYVSYANTQKSVPTKDIYLYNTFKNATLMCDKSIDKYVSVRTFQFTTNLSNKIANGYAHEIQQIYCQKEAN